MKDIQKRKFVRQAKLPDGAYKHDLGNILGPFIKKSMAANTPFQIIKRPDDRKSGTKILRINIGGNEKKGYYIIYRGDLSEIRELLARAFKQVTFMSKEPALLPDGIENT